MSKPEDIPQDVWDRVQELDLQVGGGRWDLACRAVMAERERSATRAHAWLIDWASDLAATWEGYIEAKRSGFHGGRRIKPEAADLYAKQFRERAEAVSDCADQVKAVIHTPDYRMEGRE